MKLLILRLSLLVCILISVNSCRNVKKIVDVSKRIEPKAYDYWNLVRSNPVFGFDADAFYLGISKIREIKNNVQSLNRGPEHNLDWRLEGPFNIGGRVDVLTALNLGSDTLFAGTANGGVFRTIDGGLNWNSVFDDFGSLAIGSITVDPNNNNIIYVGTGDRNFGGGSFMGNGFYKSVDFGETWVNIGLSQAGIITSCTINPLNSSEIIVGALGDPFQKTNERGIYKTMDGGATWVNTLLVSDSSGVTNVVRSPSQPSVLLASSFNRLNLEGHRISAGPDSRIYKSIDGGDSWVRITNGLPDTDQSRVGIQFSASNPSKLYAIFISVDYNLQDIYVSSDEGVSWSGIGANGGLQGLDPGFTGGFGWYFGEIYVDPFDENHIIVPGVNQYESYDAGVTWTPNVPDWSTYEVHADKHALIFQNQTTQIIGTDGGIYKTEDSGAFWQTLGALPITQFYDINANSFENGVYSGGAQDNGTTSGNYLTTEWSRDFGGDGFEVTYIDQADHSIIYETQNAGLYWLDDNNGYVDISTQEVNTNWFTPYTYKNSRIIAGSNRLMKMDNPPFGFWEPISADLTQVGLGTAISPENYHTITKIKHNSLNESQIIVGTSDGLVWLGDVDGNMQNISSNLPEKFVTSVNFSKLNSQTLFVTMSGYYQNFNQALIFKSTDSGQTWMNIANNLPAIGINSFVSFVINGNENLFIGTDGGVFVSVNNGLTWDLLGQNLPIATVSDLDIDFENKRLVAGTFGRSIWSYNLSFWINTSSINEKELAKLISPNPVSEEIEFQENALEINIVDLQGNLVLSKKNVLKGEKIDVKNLKDGIYMIEIDKKQGKLMILKGK